MALETLNGRAVSWSEIAIALNVQGGATINTIDIKSLDHETKVDRGEQRGASGGRVLKRTTGAISQTAAATFYKDGLRDLKKALVAAAEAAGFVDSQSRPQISKVTFDVVVKHAFEDDSEIYCVKLNKCHLDKDSQKHAEGTDPETSDVDLNPIEIVEVIDGKDTVLL